MIDKILIGDNPFNSVDHLSQERARHRPPMNTRGMLDVIHAASESGATGFAFSTRPIMLSVLEQVKEEYSLEIGLYPVIPDVQAIVQSVSTEGMVGFVGQTLSHLGFKSKASFIIRGGANIMTMNPIKLIQTYLEAEVSSVAKAAPKSPLKSVLLHELVTDLMVGLKMEEFFQAYIDSVRRSVGIAPGFVTRNFARFVEFAKSSGVNLQDTVVMTPFNSIGYQMNPTREACEKALGETDSDVIAMNILSSGYLSLEVATAYVNNLPRKVSCVVGVSTVSHAQRTFNYLRKHLRT